MKRAVLSLLLVLLVSWNGLYAAKKARIAFLETVDRHTRLAVLGDQLQRIGFKAVDGGKKIREGIFKLSAFNVLLVGSFALSDPTLRNWFRAEALALRRFVIRGGVVLFFVQESGAWDIEPWLPEKVFVIRGRAVFDRLGFLDEGHPLFNRPNPISLDRLNTEWKGDDAWPARRLSWWTFKRVEHAAVLGGGDASGGRPWCVEAGFGKGRALFFCCAPDKIPPELPQRTRRLCDDLLQNAVAYAESVCAGKPHPLQEGVQVNEEELDWRRFTRSITREEEKDFDRQVNVRVDQGIAWLKKTQGKDGSWGTFHASNGAYESGLTALALLALLNAGVNKYDKAIEAGFDFIFSHPPRYTYEIALTLMALEVRAAPMYERFDLAKLSPEKREKHEYRRELTPEVRDFMEQLTELLISHHKRGGCFAYDLEKGGEDISNGQFAILGLKAASRCGIKIPRSVWVEALKYFLRFQGRSGPKVKVPAFKSFSRDGTPKFYMTQGEARAWGYHYAPPPEPAQGSHVNIGVCCLILIYEELAKHRAPEAKQYRGEVRQGIKDGLAWIHANWCIDANPNVAKYYYYYYIYSLERVGTLLLRRFIGDHDWYREGAFYLMEKQEEDGSWSTQANEWGSPVANTGFALLFLKRSTPPPVITVGK